MRRRWQRSVWSEVATATSSVGEEDRSRVAFCRFSTIVSQVSLLRFPVNRIRFATRRESTSRQRLTVSLINI
jgi:hypothetical protein